MAALASRAGSIPACPVPYTRKGGEYIDIYIWTIHVNYPPRGGHWHGGYSRADSIWTKDSGYIFASRKDAINAFYRWAVTSDSWDAKELRVRAGLYDLSNEGLVRLAEGQRVPFPQGGDITLVVDTLSDWGI